MRLRPLNDYDPHFPRSVNFIIYAAVNRLRTPQSVRQVSRVADRR